MGDYLKKMEDSIGLGTGEEITGNRVVDVLLNEKRNIAETKHIRWECDVQIPEICKVHEFDLCVLFGNILDNAVEACERAQAGLAYGHVSDGNGQQFIQVQAKAVKGCFLMEVKNSMEIREQEKDKQEKRKQERDGIGLRKQERHGIGLLNIRDVVQKYNGVMNIEVQEGIFAISLLLPLSDTVHDRKRAI